MKDFLVRMGLVLGMAGFAFLVILNNRGIATFRNGIDLYAEDTDYFDVKKYDLIDTEFYMSLGCFVEEETTTKNKSGAVTSRSYTYYYAVPVYSGDETYWIGIDIKKEDRKKMEKIVDETYDYLAGESEGFGYTVLNKQGCLSKLSEKKYEYMMDMFKELELYENDADYEKYVLPVYIKTFDVEYTKKLVYISIAGALIGIITIVSMIIGSRSGKKKKSAESSIIIGGVGYTKEQLYRINSLYQQDEKILAIKELRELTGVGLAEAKNVIDHWSDYYK